MAKNEGRVAKLITTLAKIGRFRQIDYYAGSWEVDWECTGMITKQIRGKNSLEEALTELIVDYSDTLKSNLESEKNRLVFDQDRFQKQLQSRKQLILDLEATLQKIDKIKG